MVGIVNTNLTFGVIQPHQPPPSSFQRTLPPTPPPPHLLTQSPGMGGRGMDDSHALVTPSSSSSSSSPSPHQLMRGYSDGGGGGGGGGGVGVRRGRGIKRSSTPLHPNSNTFLSSPIQYQSPSSTPNSFRNNNNNNNNKTRIQRRSTLPPLSQMNMERNEEEDDTSTIWGDEYEEDGDASSIASSSDMGDMMMRGGLGGGRGVEEKMREMGLVLPPQASILFTLDESRGTLTVRIPVGEGRGGGGRGMGGVMEDHQLTAEERWEKERRVVIDTLSQLRDAAKGKMDDLLILSIGGTAEERYLEAVRSLKRAPLK